MFYKLECNSSNYFQHVPPPSQQLNTALFVCLTHVVCVLESDSLSSLPPPADWSAEDPSAADQ